MGKYNEKYFGGEHEAYDAEQLLTEGESILWRAKPKRSAFILGKVFRMLPVALLWLLFDGGFVRRAFPRDRCALHLFSL